MASAWLGSCRVLDCRVLDCRVFDCRVLDCRVLDCRVLDGRVLDCRVLDCNARAQTFWRQLSSHALSAGEWASAGIGQAIREEGGEVGRQTGGMRRQTRLIDPST
jgi:hypothetical protein